MPYSVMLVCSRKPDITPEYFQDYFENKHIQVLQSIGGPTFPKTHARHYLSRNGDGGLATIFGAPPEADAICIMTWDDKATADAWNARCMEPENARAIEEDDRHFVDRARTSMVALGVISVTRM